MLNWLTENKDALLVIASFGAAGAALFASFNFARAQTKNRRGAIRERLVGEFRLAVAEFLALADRALNRQASPQSEQEKLEKWKDVLDFYKADNAIELLISFADEKQIKVLRGAIHELKIAYTQSENEFHARSKVVALSKKIITEQLKKAGDGK